MLDYIEYLGVPGTTALGIVLFFCILQGIGEILKFKGVIVPEIMNFRGWWKKRKEAKNAAKEVPATLNEVKGLLSNVNQHYSTDNISMRDGWMQNVNNRLDENDKMFKMLSEMMTRNNADTLEIKIDNKRNYLISFAACVADDNYLASREQFARFFKVYAEYENIISENNMTNGEVDIAHRIVTDAWAERLTKHSFLEDIRGYDSKHI